MSLRDPKKLSRRERQIMDIIYKQGHATAQEVMESMDDAPGYSTVRTLLGVLERKGHLRHQRKSYHYVYFPVVPADEARSSALAHLMDTFFEGSASNVVSALMDLKQGGLSVEEHQEILDMLEKSKAEGK